MIFVESDTGKRIKIEIPIDEEHNLTCGWLVSETIRQFAKNQMGNIQANKPLVLLQTLNNIITLDYWLSDLERPVSVLKDGLVLKPFYANMKYKIGRQKINMSYFYIIKLIGAGGFSKVYLGKIRPDRSRLAARRRIGTKVPLANILLVG